MYCSRTEPASIVLPAGTNSVAKRCFYIKSSRKKKKKAKVSSDLSYIILEINMSFHINIQMHICFGLPPYIR